MSLGVFKSWLDGAILTAADLRDSLNHLVTYIRENKDRIVGDDAEVTGVIPHNHDGTYGVTLGSNSIDDGAITEAKIDDGAITEAKIDGLTATVAEINTACDGITATAAEINTACDGITATAAEINTACDGITATAAEVNTACDGTTAKNSHTHLLADGATDVMAPVTEVNDMVSFGKYNSRGMILGDVIGGRVIRICNFEICGDATADIICRINYRPSASDEFNDETYRTETLYKDDDLTYFKFSADGSFVTIKSAAFPSGLLSEISCDIVYGDQGVNVGHIGPRVIGGELEIKFYNSTWGALDMSALGAFELYVFNISYISSS